MKKQHVPIDESPSLMDKDDEEVHVYFLNDGFGSAIQVENFASQCFFGHTFLHRSSLPLVQKNGCLYWNNEHCTKVFCAGTAQYYLFCLICLFVDCLFALGLVLGAPFLVPENKNNEILENGKAMPKFCY